MAKIWDKLSIVDQLSYEKLYLVYADLEKNEPLEEGPEKAVRTLQKRKDIMDIPRCEKLVGLHNALCLSNPHWLRWRRARRPYRVRRRRLHWIMMIDRCERATVLWRWLVACSSLVPLQFSLMLTMWLCLVCHCGR